MKLMIFSVATALCMLGFGSLQAAEECATIGKDAIYDKNGNLIERSYDVYGYNYQARMFNGYYDNYSRPAIPVTEGTRLQMKWSDDWLSNRDCDLDGTLDRGGDGTSDHPSRGWLTNHESGEYLNQAGELCPYTYFVKIVYMPENCNADSRIWGSYCIIEEVSNDQCGEHGRVTNNIVGPAGLGHYVN